MLGEGITHGCPVSSAYMSRRQRDIRETASSTGPSALGSSGRNSALNSPASSPTVIPCCWEIALRPTKVACSGCSTGPYAAVAPIGLGRSRTTNRTPASEAATMQSYMVQM